MRRAGKPIGELGRVITGKTPPTKEREFFDGDYPFITPTDLDYDTYRVRSTLTTVTDDARRKFANQFIPEGAVTFTCIASVGKIGIATKDSLTNQQINSVIPNAQNDGTFLYYLLRYQAPRIQGLCSGVASPIINKTDFEKVKVEVPELDVQRRIASILSAYDDLIENNNRRIALLEQAARLLYEEWFVRLRFPGREHTRIVDGVPRGWKRVAVSETTTFLKRGIAPQYDDDAAGLVINQKCIRDGRLNLDLARRQVREFGPDRQVQVADVLINSTGEGTLGRVAQVKAPVENCTVDTHVTIVRPAGGVGQHYFGLAMLAYEPLLSTMGRGATNQTELSPAQIGATEILLPPRALMDEFEAFAGPIYAQTTSLVGQNQKARAARDLLLPRLMSGEVAT